MPKAITRKEFVDRAIEKHGKEKFNYNNLVFKGMKIPINVFCNTCKVEFFQLPFDHLNGKGCANCWKNTLKKEGMMPSELRESQFKNKYLQNSNLIILSGFKNQNSIVEVKCNSCNIIYSKLATSLRNCNKCNFCEIISQKWNIERVNSFLHPLGLTIDDSNILERYLCMSSYLAKDNDGLKCYFQPNSLLSGYVPSMFHPDFALDNFKKWITIYRPDYEFVSEIYPKTTDPVIFKYLGDLPEDINPEFETNINSFYNYGIQHPYITQSRGESIIEALLTSFNCIFKKQKTFEGLIGVGGRRLSYDFYITHVNNNILKIPILIEYQGKQHYDFIPYFHRTKDVFEKQQLHDKLKKEWAIDNNILLIEIPYNATISDVLISNLNF